MDRLACIDVHNLPLQIALRNHSQPGPLVLVREDKPTSPILQLNRAAAALRLRIGMRYSEALSIFADLRAVVVSAEDVMTGKA